LVVRDDSLIRPKVRSEAVVGRGRGCCLTVGLHEWGRRGAAEAAGSVAAPHCRPPAQAAAALAPSESPSVRLGVQGPGDCELGCGRSQPSGDSCSPLSTLLEAGGFNQSSTRNTVLR